jgi:hypothetical protein
MFGLPPSRIRIFCDFPSPRCPPAADAPAAPVTHPGGISHLLGHAQKPSRARQSAPKASKHLGRLRSRKGVGEDWWRADSPANIDIYAGYVQFNAGATVIVAVPIVAAFTVAVPVAAAFTVAVTAPVAFRFRASFAAHASRAHLFTDALRVGGLSEEYASREDDCRGNNCCYSHEYVPRLVLFLSCDVGMIDEFASSGNM